MAKQVINIGTTANDGTGTPARDAFDMINDNFTELYDGVAPRILAKTSGTSVDLANVEVVTFNYASPATITTFTNAVVGKIYTFTNIGANDITIDRTSAYLNGSANQVLASEDVLLLSGRSATTLRQAADISVNG